MLTIMKTKTIFKKISIPAVFILLIGLFIGCLNKLIYLFASFHHQLNSLNGYYYQWKFGNIFYTSKGKGKPLLLIHSLNNGASSYEYYKLYNQLSKTHKVYMIDLIGYGKSEKPKITYTAYLYVQLISDFIHHVVKEPCDIVTSGKSNAFVTMLAFQDSSLMKNIVFINPPSLTELKKNPKTKEMIFKYILELPLLGTLLFNIFSSKIMIRNQFYKKYFMTKKRNNEQFIDAFYESSHLNDANNKYTFSSSICKYNNVNITNALSSVNNSIYIIQGSERKYPCEKIIDEYKKVNYSIETSTIHKTREYPHIEKHKSVLELLSIYLHHEQK